MWSESVTFSRVVCVRLFSIVSRWRDWESQPPALATMTISETAAQSKGRRHLLDLYPVPHLFPVFSSPTSGWSTPRETCQDRW